MDHRTDKKMTDSGVDWIGELPEGWKMSPLKKAASIHLGKMLTPHQTNQKQREVSYLRAANITGSSEDRSTMWATEAEIRKNSVADNDVLVVEGGSVGFAIQIDNPLQDLIIQNSVHRIRFHENQRFGFWWMIFLYGSDVYAQLINSVSIAHLTKEKLGDIPMACPPLPLQQAIANYLDRHVGLIDEERELISKKIKLLKEQRSALIFEVVTGKRTLVEAQHLAGVEDWSDIIGSGPMVAVPTSRADDPFVKSGRLVDSGVEWIGEMPDGWETTHLKDVAVLHVGKTPSTGVPDNFDGGIPWITIADLNDRGFFPATTKKTISLTGVASCGIRKAKKGSLLVSFKLSIGKVAIAKDNVYTNEAVAAVNASKRCLNKFLLWALPVSMMNEATENIYGAKIYNQDQLGRATIPLPSLDNQQAIAEFLDQETGLIDEEIDLLSVKSGLLSEKRKTLIFEAVTGKIEING